jgi:hypothetical protein
MRAVHTRSLVAVTITTLAACGGTQMPTSPSQQGPLTLTVNPIPTLVATPGTAMFSIALKNTGSEAVTLNFPSSCQVMPYIAERGTSRIVHPAGGSWGCATVVTTLTLVPGEARIDPITVTTGSTPPSAVILPPGNYIIYAKVDDAKYHLQSASLPFTLE